MINTALRYLKAIIAGLSGVVATYTTANADGMVTGEEWIYILVALVVSSGLVGLIPNVKSKTEVVKSPIV